jgi:hypothetical protein
MLQREVRSIALRNILSSSYPGINLAHKLDTSPGKLSEPPCQHSVRYPLHSLILLSLDLLDEVLAGLDALRPLSPATVVQAPLVRWEAGLGQRGVDYGGCDACAAAGDDGLGRVDVLRFEHGLQVGGWEKGFGGWVEEISDGEGDGVRDVARGETYGKRS